MRTDLFTTGRGARPRELNIARIGVVITDGKSFDNVMTAADTARDANITMFAIGVGEYDPDELDQIANPGGTYRYEVDNFDVINNIRSLVKTAACTGIFLAFSDNILIT